jgi:hypothetical protein
MAVLVVESSFLCWRQGLGDLNIAQIGALTNMNARLFSDSLWRLETIFDVLNCVGEGLLAWCRVGVRLCI